MEFLKLLQTIRAPFLDELVALITHFGSETLFLVAALLFFWCIDKHRGYYLLFSGFCGIVSVQVLKMSFRIPRPWVLDPDFHIVESARAGATGYSFPSGHTQCATCLYGSIARSSRRTWVRILLVALLLLVGFSRMYLGVHTPKDVLVSLLIGLFWVLVLDPLIEKGRTDPRSMYFAIGMAFALALGNLLFVELTAFPADVDTVNLNDAREVAWKLLAAVTGICLIYPVESKWIRFDTHAVWWAQILKLAGGLVVVLLIKSLLKTPLNALFGACVGGFVRYLLMVLFASLVWPLTFKFFSKLGK